MSGGLELAHVTFGYTGNLALNDVSLTVPEGELRAVIGPNGAGKSTLFGVISGEHRPRSGSVRLGGRDITRLGSHGRTRLGIARAFQVARIFQGLTVRDNVRVAVNAAARHDQVFWRGGRGRAVEEKVDAMLAEMRLDDLAGRPSRALSQGDKKRLEIAMALALDARLLLLDEPTAGMSPEETDATVALVHQLWSRGGLTVVLTEHDMGVVFGLAQAITVLIRGTVLCTGTADEIQARADVREAYLGRAAR